MVVTVGCGENSDWGTGSQHADPSARSSGASVCEFPQNEYSLPGPSTMEEFARGRTQAIPELMPDFVGWVSIGSTLDEKPGEGPDYGEIAGEPRTTRSLLRVRILDAVDPSMVGTTLTVQEGQVTLSANGDAVLARRGQPCHEFKVGDEAMVSLVDEDGDGVEQFVSNDSGFFLVDGSVLSSGLAAARREAGLKTSPLSAGADGVDAEAFMADLRAAALR